MEVWVGLDDEKVWDVFYEDFNFNPSVYQKDWPSIKEPSPSKTWCLRNHDQLNDSLMEPLRGPLCKSVALAFQRVSNDGFIYALDWQHQSYKVFLNQDFLNEKPDSWKIPIIQDGDYTILLTPDFKYGYFYHPWEGSVCIYGEEFLRLVEIVFCEPNWYLHRSRE